ncbi:unnamed protein product [Caenorhabditis brenneri]
MVKTEPLDEYETEEYRKALRLYTRRVKCTPEKDKSEGPCASFDSSFQDATDDDFDCRPSPSESPDLSTSYIRPSTPEYEPLFCSAVSLDQIWSAYENAGAAINGLHLHNDCREKLLDYFQGPLAPNYPPPRHPQEAMISSIRKWSYVETEIENNVLASQPAFPSPPPSPSPLVTVRPALVPHLHPLQIHPYFPNHWIIPNVINFSNSLLARALFTDWRLGVVKESMAKIIGNAGALSRTTGPSEEQENGTLDGSARDESPKIPGTAQKRHQKLSKYQFDLLCERFEKSPYILYHERERLARMVGLTSTQDLQVFKAMFNLYQRKRAATKQMPTFDYTEEAENIPVAEIETNKSQSNGELSKYSVRFTDDQKSAMRKAMEGTSKISSHQYQILGEETGLTKQQMMRWIANERSVNRKRRTNALGVLEECFQKNHVLTASTSACLTVTTGLSYTQIQQWFQDRNEVHNQQQRTKSLRDSQKSMTTSRDELKINDEQRSNSVSISPDEPRINGEQRMKSVKISEKSVANSRVESKIDSSGFETCDAQLLQEARRMNFFGMYEMSAPYFNPNIFWNHYRA